MDYETQAQPSSASTKQNSILLTMKYLKLAIVILSILFLINLTLSSVAIQKSNDLSSSTATSSHTLAFRLFPNQELTEGIMNQVVQHNLKSAWISTCLGSLSNYSIRFANMSYINSSSTEYNQYDTFEIVSLVGTMTSIADPGYYGAHHLHISVGDKNGKTISGHLSSGSYIYTTAEIVIGYDCDVEFYRAVDGSTPWDELQIRQKKWC